MADFWRYRIAMSPCNVIVIGASAGGVGSLTELVRQLPERLPAALGIALHIPEEVRSMLPTILTREGRLNRPDHSAMGSRGPRNASDPPWYISGSVQKLAGMSAPRARRTSSTWLT